MPQDSELSTASEEVPQADQSTSPLPSGEEPQAGESSTVAQEEGQVTSSPSLPVNDERIEEIEEEEEAVEAVAAMMIADVAAAAAAEAEALAEASSARTREARHVALQADQALEEVRLAISSGALSGEDAEDYLRDAERNATRAHALLADAEAAEEQALKAAMNAEAEAEVAEGMAMAANDRAETTLEDPASSVSTNENTQPADGGSDDITLKMPTVHNQENE